MALITLDRALLQIPQAKACDHPLVSALIEACSDVAETYCQRIFTQQTWDELYSFDRRFPFLFVSNPPIASVNWVRTGLMPACQIQFADPSNTTQLATVQVTTTAVVLKTIYNGTPTTTSLSFASYPTFGALQTAVNAVSGWTATVGSQFALWGTSDLKPQGAYGARNATASLLLHWQYVSNFKHDSTELGEIVLVGGFGAGTQTVRVSYVGGYATIPDNLQQAVAELVQLTYASAKLTNPLAQSETIDRYSYTRAATTALDQLSWGSKQTLTNLRRMSVGRNRS